MNWGDFRSLFTGIAWKRLASHEVDASVSNGHEFQGVSRLRDILGNESAQWPTSYMLLRDEQDDIETIRASAKWYDSRQNQPHRSAEWRLYYPAAAGQIQAQMHAGDLMVLARTREGTLLILMAEQGSGREQQLRTLFGIPEGEDGQLAVRSFDQPLMLDFVSASILEELGLAETIGPTGPDSEIVSAIVAELVEAYPESLPPGVTVAALVRSRMASVDAAEDPDGALMHWIETEAAVYRAWEDQKIERRLNEGFITVAGSADVEAFRRFSMSLRQSRVSRAGGALQFHFRALLDERGLRYVMEPRVDGGEVPDFLFPGLAEYEDLSYPAERLRMLAAKFTAKDRWRQVLNEAERIRNKHLLTLEGSISRRQMNLMQTASLTLVMPQAVRRRYPADQSALIYSVGTFMQEVSLLQGQHVR